MAKDNDPRPGSGEAYQLYDEAWYHAIGRLLQIVRDGSDSASTNAASEILEYSKHFTILGAPHVPYDSIPDDIRDRYNLDDD
jgi:hypothetical protein